MNETYYELRDRRGASLGIFGSREEAAAEKRLIETRYAARFPLSIVAIAIDL